ESEHREEQPSTAHARTMPQASSGVTRPSHDANAPSSPAGVRKDRMRALLAAVALVACGAAGASTGGFQSPARDIWSTVQRRCGRVAQLFEPYRWPIRPFDRQHPVRGFLGDPRTFYANLGDIPTPTTDGLFSFHNGVDIVAHAGTKVYSILSGVVTRATIDEIVVKSGQ